MTTDMLSDTTDSTYDYIGWCNAGNLNRTSVAVWKIMRITKANDTIEWAGGNGNFKHIWDNRATLTYSSDLNV